MGTTLGSHGAAGRREASFSRLFKRRLIGYKDESLTALAKTMVGEEDDPSNEPDGEENLAGPAGYTYFGQFVDHDLTFETTSAFGQPQLAPTNLRTPRLDLDCVYGSGPDDQPYLYATETTATQRKGASLVLGRPLPGTQRHDLLRVGDGKGARAVIGDPRNDENTLVCNIQLAFIAFHNQVVAHLSQTVPALSDREVFEQSRQLVRWTYQRIVLEDYLPRLIEPATYFSFRHRVEQRGEGAFQLYTADKRGAIPIEFAAAAYRFGHSMVRTGYKLNADHQPQLIFTPGDGANSLLGFGPLPDTHWVEWKRFFPQNNQFKASEPGPAQNTIATSDRLQWAYRIDTSLVDPLAKLPTAISGGNSLADLNLRRANLFGVVSGQVVADAIGVAPLGPEHLVVRVNGEDGFGFAPIDKQFLGDTPLWFYILAEAQREVVDTWRRKGGGTALLDDDDLMLGVKDQNGNQRAPLAQLGPVGGNILLETFYGLLLADEQSVLTIATPEARQLHDRWFDFFTKQGQVEISMWRLLEVAGQT